jgi:hypothetical protein
MGRLIYQGLLKLRSIEAKTYPPGVVRLHYAAAPRASDCN